MPLDYNNQRTVPDAGPEGGMDVVIAGGGPRAVRDQLDARITVTPDATATRMVLVRVGARVTL
jgi:hypothetical protein